MILGDKTCRKYTLEINWKFVDISNDVILSMCNNRQKSDF